MNPTEDRSPFRVIPEERRHHELVMFLRVIATQLAVILMCAVILVVFAALKV